MTYKDALMLLKMQDRDIRKIHNTRFEHDGYQYRVQYRGGFTNYVAVDRRKIGKRNYEYFAGIGTYHCRNVGQVMDLIKQKIDNKIKWDLEFKNIKEV